MMKCSYRWGQIYYMQKSFRQVCHLVQDKYYKYGDREKSWFASCISLSHKIRTKDRKRVTSILQRKLDELESSHLDIWKPNELKALWHGVQKENGIRLRLVGSHYMVMEVLADSPAEKAGVRRGDEVIKINGQEVQNAMMAKTLEAKFTLWRKGVEKEIYLNVVELKEDLRPKIYSSNGISVLKIPSFVRAHLMDESYIKKIFSQMKNTSKLVIDLRNNTGGDFVKMLDILGYFICKPTKLGSITKNPRTYSGTYKGEAQGFFQREDDPDRQIEVFTANNVVDLVSFQQELCFKGQAIVLVNEYTGSSAEIFAQALFEHKAYKSYGQYTSGDVLLAIWYPILLGPRHNVSIPEGLYTSSTGKVLENNSVEMEKLLLYDLDLLRQGLDPWLEQAREFFY